MKEVAIAASFFSSLSQTIVGKWHPISFKFSGVIEGDVTNGVVKLSESADSILISNNEQPDHKEIYLTLGKIYLEKIKYVTECFFDNGTFYIENNDVLNGRQVGKYIIDTASNLLKRSVLNINQETYLLSFKSDNILELQLVQKNEGKAIGLSVEYKRVY